ncbi:MAG: SufD family Fe-S cluster assembly protein, partial [Acidobacteriota bacterium]
METIYGDAFRRSLSAVSEPADLRRLREEAFAIFTDLGFPVVKSEDWKYTNVAPLSGVEWKIAERASGAAEDIDFESLKRFDRGRNGFAALNLAFGEFATLRIKKDTVVDQPVEFTFAADEGSARFPHLVVIAEAGSKATIVETYASPSRSFMDTAIQIFVEDNANLTHYRVQKESPDVLHYGATEI